MEIKKRLAIISFGITVFLLITIILLGSVLNNEREETLTEQFDMMSEDFNNMQILFLMSESYDNELACLAFENKLKELDTTIWTLGEKIDKYRTASEEFMKDPYYLEQKKSFNENEVFYFLLMKRMIDRCNISKEVLLFFYQNSADCKKCDDQSFILADINELDDEDGRQEVAIFSFDMDLNISTVSLLSKYYKTSNYPCIVMNEEVYCGIQDKNFIMNKICTNQPRLYICSIYK